MVAFNRIIFLGMCDITLFVEDILLHIKALAEIHKLEEALDGGVKPFYK